jgi:hypothetical protein
MRMWVYSEETPLNPKELKNKLLLSKGINGSIAWHRAAFGGSLRGIRGIMVLGKKWNYTQMNC